MKEQEQKMKLPKLDDLFTIQEQRDYEKAEKVEEINISSIKDFPNHPWFGVGFGNYASVFDRYFSARFYEYTRSETYFDRAHNNLIDIVSTTGIVGLLAYLSIFVAVAIYLLKLIKKDPTNFEPLILIGLFIFRNSERIHLDESAGLLLKLLLLLLPIILLLVVLTR
jgi:O-antigen ligase